MKAGLLTAAASAMGLNSARAQGTQGTSKPPVLTVQGEAAVRTNIPAPVVRDRRASGGRYLALNTKKKPPKEGWYATYAVRAPEAGVYALTAVATAPVETPHTEATASYLQLALNEGRFIEIARSQPYWYESKPAWGGLSVLDLGELELRRGENTLTFRVTEPAVLETGTAYALALDRFTLRRREGVELSEVRAGGDGTLGTYRYGEPASLTLGLHGRPDDPYRVRYTVVDYFGERVAEGYATIAAGETTVKIPLPQLPPGNYRVAASGADASDAEGVVGHFACLPARPAPSGDANRFGVNVWATSLLPPPAWTPSPPPCGTWARAGYGTARHGPRPSRPRARTTRNTTTGSRGRCAVTASRPWRSSHPPPSGP